MNEHIDQDPSLLNIFPNIKNKDWFKANIDKIIDDFYGWHKKNSHAPDHLPVINGELYSSMEHIIEELSLQFSKHSVPWNSLLYNAHMNSDIPIISLIGYLVGMLYNPNNVTDEVSPVSTALEKKLSIQFSTLFGYDPESAWAHITSGAHSSNYEALWIARNLKSIPLAAMEHKNACKFLTDQDKINLSNLPVSRVLELISNMQKENILSEVIQLGTEKRSQIINAGKILISENCHYSWDKCADVLGVSKSNIEKISPDENFRTDIEQLKKKIHYFLENDIPIIAVILFVGSSGEGSVDDVTSLAEFKNYCEKNYNKSFYLHIDAAFGGYFRTLILNEENTILSYDFLHKYLKEDVYKSLRSMSECDSITFDPHKSGYVQYPAGGIAIKDRRLSSIISSASKYFGYNSTDINFGPHTFEGARAGAAITATWALYQTLPLNCTGIGHLLLKNIETANNFYKIIDKSHSISVGNDDYRVTPLYKPDLTINNFVFSKSSLDCGEIITTNSKLFSELQLLPNDFFTFSKSSIKLSRLLSILGGNPYSGDGEVILFRSCIMKHIPYSFLEHHWKEYKSKAASILTSDKYGKNS